MQKVQSLSLPRALLPLPPTQSHLQQESPLSCLRGPSAASCPPGLCCLYIDVCERASFEQEGAEVFELNNLCADFCN